MSRLLKWSKPNGHPQDSEDAIFVANGLGGRYSVESDGTLWFAHDEFTWELCADVAAAKERAEADFRERLAPLLDALRSPAPAQSEERERRC